MADDFVYRPRYEIPNCNQVQVFKMNDDGSITYTDVEGDLSQTRYVPERTCKIEWKHIGDDVVAGYCECGLELDRLRDYEPAYLPNYCPRCGVKVVA